MTIESSREQRTRSTRRSFLRAVGASALALPFYRMLENDVVRAQGSDLPQKFVGVGTFHCTSQQFYARQAGETDTEYDIGYADCCLRPFDDAATYGRSFRDDLIIFEGFDYGVGEIGPSGEPLHVPMHGALGIMLTGSSATGGDGMDWQLQNESLDVYLASRFGGETPFRSVRFCNETDYGVVISSWNCISAGPGGTFLGSMTDPAEIFDTYFTSLVLPDDEAARLARERQLGIDRSVLDYVSRDIQRLSGKLAGPERERLDHHLTAVRDLERRLMDPAIAATCTVPTRHSASADGYLVANGNNGGEYYFDQILDFQIELLAQLLICDLTRFSTLVMSGTSGTTRGAEMIPVEYDSSGGTDRLAIGTDMRLPYNFHDNIAHLSGNSATGMQQIVASMRRYYNGKIARLMQRLDAAGALSSTLILVGNEGGDGAGHSTKNVPLLLAGGANGALTMGRRVVAPGRTARVGEAPSGVDMTSHNPILVDVANLFGAEIDSFGTCAETSFTRGSVL